MFNRLQGVKYGGVKFKDGPLHIVETKKLKKLNDSIYQNHGEFTANLKKDSFEKIVRRTGPLQKGANIPKGDGKILVYLNTHGASQIYDIKNKESVMNICEHLKNPIWTYLKSLI